jgi:hypothetical protein
MIHQFIDYFVAFILGAALTACFFGGQVKELATANKALRQTLIEAATRPAPRTPHLFNF